MVRVSSLLVLLAALVFAAVPARAQQNGFDLAGPVLALTVTRGDVELPVGAVPSLLPGDRLRVEADFPEHQSARYLMIVVFLRGATNPPPKDWFYAAETWRKKKNRLDLKVPDGAEQAVVLLAPETGGGFDSVRDAVRGRPGVFVRAAQDLHQASLDRARLDAFVTAIGRIGEATPQRLAEAAPVLANALRIKLKAECLSRPRGLQAACLTQDRDNLVLQAQRGSTLAETLTGTPVDLAYRIAATPEGGGGYFSPYIGLARDLARLFGAFRSPQYQYLPALSLARSAQMQLLLNAAPSFQSPRSVLVAALPPIGPASRPLWRAAGPAPVCLGKPDLALPLDDAPLLYATDYARDLAVQLTGPDGKARTLPVLADVEKGGVRLAGRVPEDLGAVSNAVLQGRWGFDGFTGPRLPVQRDAAGAWHAEPDAGVVVGRDHPLVLRGGAAFCVSQLVLRDAKGVTRPLTFKITGQDEISTTLPLGDARPGKMGITIARFGTAAPETLELAARLEASRIDRFVLHAGDREGVLEGARLDQVAGLDLGGVRFAPGALSRGEKGDRLVLAADAEPLTGPGEATIRLQDGRTVRLAVKIAEPRPAAALLSRAATGAAAPGALPLTLPDGLLPADATIAFSFKIARGSLARSDHVEIATMSGGATGRLGFADGALQRVAGDVIVARFDPRALLGPGVAGQLRFRLVQDGVAGNWQPLATLVRLPVLTGVTCTELCDLHGRDLFLLSAVSTTADFAKATSVPLGFVGDSLRLPRLAGKMLFVRLHDSGDAVVGVTLGEAASPARQAGGD